MSGILDWLIDWGGTFFRAIWRFLTSWWALVFGLVLVVVEFFAFVAYALTEASRHFAAMTLQLIPMVQQTIDSGPNIITTGLGVANCLLPVDYALAAAGTLLSFWIYVLIWKGLVALYRMIPFNG